MNKSLMRKAKKLRRQQRWQEIKEKMELPAYIAGLAVLAYLTWPTVSKVISPSEISGADYKKILEDVRNHPDCLQAKRTLTWSLENKTIAEWEKESIDREIAICSNPSEEQREEMETQKAVHELTKHTMPGPLFWND